jgi:hypothetical protein
MTTKALFSGRDSSGVNPALAIFEALEMRKVSKQNFLVLSKKRFLERAGSRIRTDDLLITNQLLYQLSYAGKNAAHINAHCRLEQVADARNANAS